MIARSPRAAGRGEGADRASAPVARMSAAKCGAPDFAPLIRATSRRAGDAAFFSVGARSSDLDKLSGRLTTCSQANERATCKSHEVEHRMSNRSQLFCLATASAVCFGTPAFAQDTVKIGELNSYKAQPAFLEPYKRGWELAIEDINAKGGVLGKKLEVISRDDGATPGDAVRVANELVTREGTNVIAGTFLSHIGLAVTEFAGKEKVFFLAAEPLTDKITWQNGNKYTFGLRPSTYMQVAMLMPDAVAAKKKRWAVIYPNFEYGQSAATWFKEMLRKAQPDAIFNVLFGADLAKLVREGTTRGTFKNRVVVSLLSGEPEYLDPLKDEAPVGWIVTGYPWDAIDTPAHKAFVDAYQKRWNDYPRLGSVVGYDTMKSLAAGIAKAGATDTDKLIAAFRGLKLTNPFGAFEFRAIDHQATMGAYV